MSLATSPSSTSSSPPCRRVATGHPIRTVAYPPSIWCDVRGIETTASTVFPPLFSTGKRQPISDRTPPASAGWTTDITIFDAVAERSPSLRPIVIYFHGSGFTLFSAASRTYDALNRHRVRQPPSRPGASVTAATYDVWAKVRPGRLLQHRGLPRRRRLVMATGCPIFCQVKITVDLVEIWHT